MASNSNRINLRTADGQLFDVEERVAMEFGTVKSFFEDNSNAHDRTVMPLPNVSASALTRIITFCKKHLEFRANSVQENEIKAFNTEFLKDETNKMMKELILAANFLEVKEFLEVLLDSMAKRIQNKSVAWARQFFGVENDFTPKEEAALREECAWTFQGVDKD